MGQLLLYCFKFYWDLSLHIKEVQSYGGTDRGFFLTFLKSREPGGRDGNQKEMTFYSFGNLALYWEAVVSEIKERKDNFFCFVFSKKFG